jgi:DNA-binding CsgD family transcriptional regulator
MSRRILAPEEEAEISSLYKEGKNCNQISKALNLAYSTVQRRIKNLQRTEGNTNISRQQQIAEEERRSMDLFLQKHKPVSPDEKKALLARGKKRSGVVAIYSTPELDTPIPAGLTHTSVRHVLDGELVTFVHDTSNRTVSIEIEGREPLLLMVDAFKMFANDIENMKILLFGEQTARD